MRLLVGLDDTDVLGHKPGTGRLARELSVHLAEALPVRAAAVIRQQLLVDPRIPYTSHNSPACMILEALADDAELPQRLFDEAARWVLGRAAPGSDPGLCLAAGSQVDEAVHVFGQRASEIVLRKQDAHSIARRSGLRLEELGGSGDGVIGALAAVGLTATGNSGRYLELAGRLRLMADRVSGRALRDLGITVVSAARNADPVPDDAAIETAGWLRPRLVHGRPVLFVEPNEDRWRCFDRKSDGGDGHGGGDEC